MVLTDEAEGVDKPAVSSEKDVGGAEDNDERGEELNILAVLRPSQRGQGRAHVWEGKQRLESFTDKVTDAWSGATDHCQKLSGRGEDDLSDAGGVLRYLRRM